MTKYCKICKTELTYNDEGWSDGLCQKCYDELATYLECSKEFIQERDIQLCDDCVDKFDLNRLWKLHDNNKLDALDFNESKKIRERFRVINYG